MILLFTSLFSSTFWPRPHSWLCSRQFEVLSSGYISPASSQSSSNVSAVPSLPVSALYVNAWQRPRSPSRLVIGCLRLSEFVELSILSSPASCTRSFVRVLSISPPSRIVIGIDTSRFRPRSSSAFTRIVCQSSYNCQRSRCRPVSYPVSPFVNYVELSVSSYDKLHRPVSRPVVVI